MSRLVITAVRWAVAGAVAFVVASAWAYADRGYWAVGGEYLFLTAPALGVTVRVIRDQED